MYPSNSPRLTKNNFDLLRFLFALTVCLYHGVELSGFQELAPINQVLSSTIAVRGFFVVSGFLIFMSFERSSSLCSYTKKRIRRIYPAYFTVVMLCAIGLVVVSSKSPREYFSFAWIKYVFANLSFLNFLQLSLPGVFTDNKLTAVNGALWTLKVEAMFYASVPIFVFLFRKYSHLLVLTLTYCLSVTYAWSLSIAAAHTGIKSYAEMSHQFPGQLSYFISGALFYYFLPLFERYVAVVVIFSISILVINRYLPLLALEPLSLACIVIFFGLFFCAGNFGKYGDFSYGVYILHFPIIQLVIYSGFLRESPWCFYAVCVSLTLISAFALWHLVEKRFLLRSNHYIANTMVHKN